MTRRVAQHRGAKSRRRMDRKAKKIATAATEIADEKERAAVTSKGRRILFIVIAAVISDLSFRLYGGYLQNYFSSEWGKNLVALVPPAFIILLVWLLWPRDR